ncbi:MAG: chromosome partitioning protein, partial [Treponema sp.]|nr:chromosome partitioning protein [Treponema sp.]
MERPEDLSGMDAVGAREYILNVITTRRLTEKKIRELDEELALWDSRISAARSRGQDDLAAEAEAAAEKIKERRTKLAEEAAGLRCQID